MKSMSKRRNGETAAEIGQRIKFYRFARHLTQEELAAASGLSRVAIGNYERGDREPGIGAIEKLAKALGCSPSVLVGWESEEKKNKGGGSL